MDRKKFAMNYGAVLGLALSLLGIIFWSMNINEQTWIVLELFIDVHRCYSTA